MCMVKTGYAKGGILSKGIKFSFALLALLALLALAEPSLAGETHAAPRWGDFAWRIVNLILFCGILWYFTGNLIKNFFRNRKQSIKDTLDELEQRREKAKNELAEIESRIASLEAERQAILNESRAQANRLKQGIVEEAKKQADQIVAQAKRAAENESRAKLDEVRASVANEIVDAAAKALRGKLTEKDHDKLIADSLDKVVLQ